MQTFVESEHPRAPRGSPGGGRFVTKGGVPEVSESKAARKRRPSLGLYEIPEEYKQIRSKREVGEYVTDTNSDVESAIEALVMERESLHEALEEGDASRYSNRFVDEWEAIDTLDDALKETELPESLVAHRLVDPEAKDLLSMEVGDTTTILDFTHVSLLPINVSDDYYTPIKILVDVGQPGIINKEGGLILPRAGEMRLMGSDKDGERVFRWLGTAPEKIVKHRRQKREDVETLNYLNSSFPNLKEAHKDGEETGVYNCYAWALGDDTRWWGPGHSMYWPLPFPRNHAPNTKDFDELLVDFFHAKELSPDPKNQKYEKGFVKLALFAYPDGDATHLAKLLPTGEWQSKIGHEILARHGKDIRDMNEGSYADVVKLYKLDEKEWAQIKDFKPTKADIKKHKEILGETEDEDVREAALGVEPILRDSILPTQSIMISAYRGEDVQWFDKADQVALSSTHDVEVMVNPTEHDVLQMAQEERDKRGNGPVLGFRSIRDVNANLYVWVARNAIHDQAMQGIQSLTRSKISFDDTTGDIWSVNGNKLPKFVSNIIKRGQENAKKYVEQYGTAQVSVIAPDVVESLMRPRVAQVSTIAKQAAKEQGYDPDKISVIGKSAIRRVGDRQWAVAATASEDGEIKLYALAIQNDKRIPGFVAHEIEHQKYWKLMDDTFKAPIGSPLRQKFDQVFVKPMKQLSDTGRNISDYATSWWTAAEEGRPLPAADIARNETLAEIARIEKETGALPPNLSPEWKAAYDLVNEHWKESRR